MLVYKKGDVLNSAELIVVHGCNCFKAMGAGIARQVREQCPNAYKADQDTLWGDRTKLGTYTKGVEENGMTIINAYTQYKYTHTEVDLDYEALEKVFNKICEDYTGPQYPIIAMPKIGCGLAGGDWNTVSRILEYISEKHGKTFHIYELE